MILGRFYKITLEFVKFIFAREFARNCQIYSLHPDRGLQRVNFKFCLHFISVVPKHFAACGFKFYVEFKILNMRRKPLNKNARAARLAPWACQGLGDFKGEGEHLAIQAPSRPKKNRNRGINFTSCGFGDKILFCKFLQDFMDMLSVCVFYA